MADRVNGRCRILPVLSPGSILVGHKNLGFQGEKMMSKKEPYSDTGNRIDRSLDSDDVEWSQTFSSKPVQKQRKKQKTKQKTKRAHRPKYSADDFKFDRWARRFRAWDLVRKDGDEL
jgi:hypothetical protein